MAQFRKYDFIDFFFLQKWQSSNVLSRLVISFSSTPFWFLYLQGYAIKYADNVYQFH